MGNPTQNEIGNTILALNAAGSTSILGPSSADGQGVFASLGNNIIGTTSGISGLGASDQTNVTAAQLNLGPLLNNGGVVQTIALLPGSVAINAGNNNLVPPGVTTDARGTGFDRIVGNNVDVGAVEFFTPTITTLNPTSASEWGPAFTLTITGSKFSLGAAVTFGTDVLTPISVSSDLTQLTVTIPAKDLLQAGSIPVTVDNPDGSGIAGHFVTSPPVNFTVSQPPTLPLNGPGNQSDNEGDTITALQVTSPDPNATGFTATGLPTGLSINPTTGLISGVIDPRGANVYSVTIRASDSGLNGSTSFTWTVADTTPPLVTNPGNLTNTAGDTVSGLTLLSTDADPGTWTATGLPTGLSIDKNSGVISGTIDGAASGNFSVTVSASDGATTTNVSFNWKVNDLSPPVLNSPGSQANNEGDSVSLPVSISNFIPGTITASSLPPGLSIDKNTGIISGVIDPRGPAATSSRSRPRTAPSRPASPSVGRWPTLTRRR